MGLVAGGEGISEVGHFVRRLSRQFLQMYTFIGCRASPFHTKIFPRNT